MNDLATLGRQIANRRKSLGQSQAALAQRARTSRATLDALENGRPRDLGYAKVTRILAALGLELELQEASVRRPTLDELRDEDRHDQGLDRRG
ncbi:MAG TPA: helix-turn-helix transcriptional regulator [Terriglobales bacterium]|nr:helix-turn-helix transcriptional regulator [Terriglobales bacterium]